jgi:multiple sugar transport system permease protein
MPWRWLLLTVFCFVACCAPAQEPKKVTLRLTSWDGDESLRVLRKSIARFEERYPHIEVRLENIDWSLYFQKILTQYAANVAPDVAMMGFQNFQSLAKRGALLPLNDFFAETPGFDINEYYKEIVDAHSFQGNVYVLPRDIAPISLIYYNKRMFDEAGIPYPDGTWTWDFKVRPELREKDFLWVVRELTKRDGGGKTTRWGYAPGWPQLLADSFALPYAGDPVDNLEAPTKILANSEKHAEAYQFAADLMNKEKWVPNNAEVVNVLQTNTRAMFTSQRVAMFQSGIWEVPNIRKVLEPGKTGFFDYDITWFPAFRDGSRRYTTGGSGYCILSSTKHPKEAWLLTQWMAGPEGMKDLAESGLAQPAIRSLSLREPWIPGPNTPEPMQYPKNRIVTDLSVPHVTFGPTADYWPEVRDLVNARLDGLWNGETTAKAALDRGVAEGQARLDAILVEQHLPPFNWWIGLALGAVVIGSMLFWVYWPERHVKTTLREKQESRTAYWFISPFLIGLVVFTLGPMVLSLLMSFADWDVILPARWRGLQNYQEAFTGDPRFWVSLRVTFVYTFFAVPLGVLGSLGLALLLNQKVRGMPLYRTCYYLPSLASVVAASLIWRRLFQPEGGLINTIIYGADGKGDFLGLATFLGRYSPTGEPVNWLGNEATSLPALIIMSLWGIGGGMVILLAGLQAIPQHYYEAALLDGAGTWKKFRNVTFPLLTPSLFFVLITGVIGSFQVFTQAFVITAGGPGDSTRFFMLHLYNQAFTSLRMGYASALAWVLFVIILFFTMVQFKMSKWVYYESEVK